MYEISFAKLSEKFFRGTTWPPVEYIAELVDKDSVFCLLYKVHCNSNHARHLDFLMPLATYFCRVPLRALYVNF